LYLLLDKARPTDPIARYKEDRFVVVLPGSDMHGAWVLAKRLCKTISETNIIIPNECVLPPATASFGITELKDLISDDALLSDAERALESAQHKGGNAVAEHKGC